MIRGGAGTDPAARPEVTLKWAQTLDGRIATSTGDSRWISGLESRRIAHRLRAEHDAVLVGIGTVLADDPQLTVRLVPGRDPLRVVVDSSLRIPLDCALLSSHPEATLVVTTDRASPTRRNRLEAMDAEVIEIPGRDDRVDLPSLLQQLARRDVRRLLVEGGARIITSLLRARLADRVVIFTAPKIVGAGVSAVGDLGSDRLDQALTFAAPELTMAGPDLIFSAGLRPQWD